MFLYILLYYSTVSCVILIANEKFVLLDLQNTDVRDEYEGEFLENSTYRFTSTKNPENSIEVVLIEKDKASFVRHTPEFCLSGTLKRIMLST